MKEFKAGGGGGVGVGAVCRKWFFCFFLGGGGLGGGGGGGFGGGGGGGGVPIRSRYMWLLAIFSGRAAFPSRRRAKDQNNTAALRH